MPRKQGVKIAVASALLLSSWPAAAGDAPAAVAVAARLTQDDAGAELVFDLSRPVEAHAYALASPDRIVVDLPEVNFQIDPALGRAHDKLPAPIVKAFRFGLLAPGKSRIVIDLSRPACPGQIESKPISEGEAPSRLKIELRQCDSAAFAGLVPSLSPADVAADGGADPPPVIVLDPGHGGVDGGARGVGGVLEKNLAYEFCRELKRRLDATHKYKVVMTRRGDQYVDLDDRVAIARNANANLFISVHADALRESPDVSGSTVYTGADRPSDAEAARIAARENAADRGRKKVSAARDDPGVADILFDLKRRETRAYAHIFSRGLVDNLRPAARLNRNPERSAHFVVLKAPEFPSVLVELGYLSNPEDAKALATPEWRAKAAEAATQAIDAFFQPQEKPAADTGVALGTKSNAPATDR